MREKETKMVSNLEEGMKMVGVVRNGNKGMVSLKERPKGPTNGLVILLFEPFFF